jgi:D-alanyl-D-alanine dipeptidase
MTINFKAEVEKRKDAMMADLFSLLEINSERDDSLADKEHPFGPGPVKALEKFLEIAERDGYETTNVDNYAGHFTFGQGEEELGIFAHLDVVPAGSGWHTDPYKPEIIDGKLYARGASDDKGPTVACYYGLKIIKELGLPVSKRVRFVAGTDEESGWADMDYYFAHVGLPKPDFGFSPDAEFPIINGEKGNITEYLHFDGENDGDFVLHSLSGGLRVNMVPESGKVVFSGNLSLAELQERLEAFTAENPVTARLTEENGQFHLQVIGKSAHGASPASGINGVTYLANFLSQFAFAGTAKNYLHIAGQVIHKDHLAAATGVAYVDEKMGELTMNAGVFSFDKASSDNTIALNFRFPQGTDEHKIKAVLETLSGVREVSLSEHMHTPHYTPMEDELVSTLLAVYEKQTGLKGHEQIIGGGTFGRLLKRGVAFGAMFPGYTDTMHQANEFADVEDLFRASAIYAEGIYELIK